MTTADSSVSATEDHTDTEIGNARKINPVVLIGSAAVILALAVWAMVRPGDAENAIFVLVGWISTWFGWWYFLLAAAILVFVLVVGISRAGRVKLGPEESKPQFNIFTWAAMLFAAGIGTDLMFFSVAEPAAQYLAPPLIEGGTSAAAREAIVWTLFHYGLIGWAMYALLGMALAYFHYRRGLPLSLRSVLQPLFGDRVWGRAGHLIDIAAVMGTVFGLAATLGIGVSMLSRGLHELTGVDDGLLVQICLIVVAVIMSIVSTISGVARGVRRLSEIQAVLAFVLLAFVLFTGDTAFLLNGLVMNAGDYIAQLPVLTLDTMAFEAPTEWMNAWTLFFWAWWVAWAPFVGLFLARISRGRTIRQFVLGTMTIPFGFVLVWVSVFGNTTLQLGRDGTEEGAAFIQTAMDDPAGGLFGLLQQFPAAGLMISVAIFVGLLFFVTSADSGALVLAKFSTDPRSPKDDAVPWLRVVWAVLIGMITLGMLTAGGLGTLQGATMIMGLPFSFVLLLVMVSLYRTLHAEGQKLDSAQNALPATLSGRTHAESGAWRHRLHRLVSYPGHKPIARFLEEVCSPALDEVAAELRDRGVTARCDRSDDGPQGLPILTLAVVHDDDEPFRYRLYPVEAEMPSFAAKPQSEATYLRVEVYLTEGSQGYEVTGWTKEQLIGDVLDQFERHVVFKESSAAPAVSIDHTDV
ncbi:choline BCCT transporter BetT [Isoptericola croceus]|uniref:choline BCCT transporter BetT n=1 Tax=Isoptericola croceus TaxID=3031406 RepID=UPI0023F7D56A|nr:choline BCCT transporter BetT [Isoptericola croceus]